MSCRCGRCFPCNLNPCCDAGCRYNECFPEDDTDCSEFFDVGDLEKCDNYDQCRQQFCEDCADRVLERTIVGDYCIFCYDDVKELFKEFVQKKMKKKFG